MFKSKKLIILLLVLTTILIVLASVDIYYVEYGAGGTLLWNSNDAYVFLNVVSRGYHMSVLKFIVEIPLEFLRWVPFPNDKRFSTSVVELAPNTGHQHVRQDVYLNSFMPFEGQTFSGDLETGEMWKWSGTDLQKASMEEQKRFHDSKTFSELDLNDADTWSKRSLVCGNLSEFPIEVGGTRLTVVRRCGFLGGVASIDLLRVSQPAQRLWHLDDGFHRVSKVEYENRFQRR